MELDAALREFDRVEANLKKLETVWGKLQALVPEGIVFCGGGPEDREYRQLCRDYARLLTGIPPINGWSISEEPQDLDAIAQARLDAREIDEPEAVVAVERGIYAPSVQIDEYRSRLQVARRALVRSRLDEIVPEVDALLAKLAEPLVSRDDYTSVRGASWERLERLVSEVDRLFGPVSRSRAWANLHRHLGFATGRDLFDIKDCDWPAVKNEIALLAFDESEPLPVAIADLGTLAGERPTGQVSTALDWTALNDDGFERLLFAIISDARGYENPEWLMHTHAPDRGRDLSVWRVRNDSLAGVCRERVIIQCKHWLTRSVTDTDVANAITKMAHWEPPAVDVLVVASSGRFTADAVRWVEQHNLSGKRPKLEPWPDSALERQLAERPHLVAAFKLRG